MIMAHWDRSEPRYDLSAHEFGEYSNNKGLLIKKHGPTDKITNMQTLARYVKMNPVEFLTELSERLLTENLTLLAEGGMLLNGDGIVITDDVENEYISQSNPPLVIETEYAVQLSWLFFRLTEGLSDMVIGLGKKAFYEELGLTALGCIARGTDLTGLVMGVLAKAALLEAQDLRNRSQAIRNELLSSAGALSDLAEKID